MVDLILKLLNIIVKSFRLITLTFVIWIFNPITKSIGITKTNDYENF